MKKVLVIGAGGFMGQHVTRRLAEQGDTVVGLDKFKPAETGHILEWHDTDSHDLNYLKQAAEGCHAAVFLGGYSRPGDRVRSIVEAVPEVAGAGVGIANAKACEKDFFVVGDVVAVVVSAL